MEARRGLFPAPFLYAHTNLRVKFPRFLDLRTFLSRAMISRSISRLFEQLFSRTTARHTHVATIPAIQYFAHTYMYAHKCTHIHTYTRNIHSHFSRSFPLSLSVVLVDHFTSSTIYLVLPRWFLRVSGVYPCAAALGSTFHL